MLKTLRSSPASTGHRDDNTGFILTATQRSLSQLVTVRTAHQTKCAAKSVKTRSSPQDSDPKPAEQTDRQRLCAQMAEVVCRTGTGLERGVRWRSRVAPGTRSPEEVLTLTGNSANAELAAKERVNTVGNSHHWMRDHKLTNPTGSSEASQSLQ